MARVEIEVDDTTLVACLQELKKRMDQNYCKGDASAYAQLVLDNHLAAAYNTARAQVLKEMKEQFEAVYDTTKGSNAKPGTK